MKIENLDTVSILKKIVAVYDIAHPIHGTTYCVRARSAFEAVFVRFALCWARVLQLLKLYPVVMLLDQWSEPCIFSCLEGGINARAGVFF